MRVLRRLDEVPWWSRPLAYDCSAASAARSPAPSRSASRRRCCLPAASALVRGWIDGVPLHIAKPYGDAGYFRSAKAALRALHRAGIAHNDLAKEQNWLYAQDSRTAAPI